MFGLFASRYNNLPNTSNADKNYLHRLPVEQTLSAFITKEIIIKKEKHIIYGSFLTKQNKKHFFISPYISKTQESTTKPCFQIIVYKKWYASHKTDVTEKEKVVKKIRKIEATKLAFVGRYS